MAERLGSLITTHLALEQGRRVFAVPGSPMDPRCRGSNRLIRQGATLVQDAVDVVEIFEPMLNRPALWQPALLKDAVWPVQGAIGAAPETSYGQE